MIHRPHVVLNGITKNYGSKTVLDGLDLSLGESEMVALLGPSGCGKSTTLRILAGLEQSDGGTITIGGEPVTKVPARKRNMGIVFQAYSLFPHLTALDNVAYGLKTRGVDKAKRRERAAELLELVQLTGHLESFPAELSGGQQQRVALARALAIEPEVLLLDEPLSALDAKVRGQLRDEIRHIQLTRGIATLLVTHDQEEAITMADRVGVMRSGRIEQIGSPANLYQHPETPFIAQFVGICNRIPGEVRGNKIDVFGSPVTIVNSNDESARRPWAAALVRPEQIVVSASENGRFVLVDTMLRGIFTSALFRDERTSGTLRVDMSTPEADSLTIGGRFDARVLREDTVVDALTGNEASADLSPSNADKRGQEQLQ